jgi:hypothetical protein
MPLVQPLTELPPLNETWKFIAVFTTAIHWFTSWARSIQYMPLHSISPRSLLILSTYICLGLLSALFPTEFATKNPHAFSSPIHSTWPAHLIVLDFTIQIILGDECKLRSSTLSSFLHPLVTSSLFVLNILLSTLLANTLNLHVYSTLNIRTNFHTHTTPWTIL